MSKIISLTAENIKRIKAVYIKPDGNVVTLTGENEAGKSSILDAIEWALAGAKSIQKEPLRTGTKEGKVVLDLGDYIVKRVFTKKKTYLKVEAADGSEIKKPQALLDSLVGAVSFDPLYFIEQDDKTQADILFNLIGVDISDKDRIIAGLREKRTQAGREEKTLSVKASEPAEFVEPVDIDTINNELVDANKHNKQRDELKAECDRIFYHMQNLTPQGKTIAGYIDVKEKQIRQLQQEIEELQNQQKTLRKDYAVKSKELEVKKEALTEMPEIDTNSIFAKLEAATEANRKAQTFKLHQDVVEEHKAKQQEYDSFTTEIKRIEQEKAEMLEQAKWPVPGLSVTENGVMYEGVPLEQVSDGRKLCIGITIGMALNPTLRVLRLGNASLLDKTNMKMIHDLVKEKDYQIWIERVEDDDASAILIEDGMIAVRKDA
jgi:DNA repair exonuclease SbcCD ATPase subunit